MCAARLDADIKRFGLAERVSVLGAVSDARITELYQSADVFVLASRFEGYGMAFAEAIAHGLPVVGTTAGAIPDTVPNGVGALVPPDDAVALAHLGLDPLLDLDLRLGEGTGAVLALSVVQAAAKTLREMATFDGAGVSREKD